MKDGSVTSMLTSTDKMKLNAAMIKGKNLIDDKEQHETFVFVDFLKELEKIFESALNKINKGYSDEESDSDWKSFSYLICLWISVSLCIMLELFILLVWLHVFRKYDILNLLFASITIAIWHNLS